MNGKTAAAAGFSAVLIALGAGVGVGQAMSASPAQDAAHNGPQPTVTTTAHDVRDEVPEACLQALDEADKGFTEAGAAFGVTHDVLTGDLSTELGLLQLTQHTKALNDLAPSYNAHKAQCRAAAGQG